jgi:hypothetical protein
MQQAENTKSEMAVLAQLWQEIRIGFISQGTSLNKFCAENGIHRPNAKKAFSGHWNGKKAIALRKRLIEASTAQAITIVEV